MYLIYDHLSKRVTNVCKYTYIIYVYTVQYILLSNTWTVNFQTFKLVLEKAEEPETKLPTLDGIIEKAIEFQKNIYFCFIDYAKTFDCVDHSELWTSRC